MPEVTFGPWQSGWNAQLNPRFLTSDQLAVAKNTSIISGSITPQYTLKQDYAQPFMRNPAAGAGVPLSPPPVMHRIRLASPYIASGNLQLSGTGTAAGGSLPAGTYYWYAVHYDVRGRESNVIGSQGEGGKPLYWTMGASQKLTLTFPAAGGEWVGTRIYRAAASFSGTYGSGKPGPFLLVGSVAAGTSTWQDPMVSPSSSVLVLRRGWLWQDPTSYNYAVPHYATEDNGVLYLVNQATVGPLRWAGERDLFYPLGVNPGATAPTAAASATAGVLNGTYQYVYTSVTFWGAESQPSPVSAAVTVAGKQVTVSGILAYPAPAPPQFVGNPVIARRLYRTGGTGEWQLVAEIADNTTTTYTDNVPDTDLGETLVTDTYAPPPVDVEGVCGPHNGSLFFWRGNRLYWSEQGNYSAVPVFNYVDFPSEIQRAVPWAGDLLVLTASDEWLLVGADATSYQKVPLSSSFGCTHGKSVALSEHGVLWLSSHGVVLYSQGSPSIISGALGSDYFKQVYATYKIKDAIYHKGTYRVAFAVGNYTQGNFVLAGDLSNPAQIAWREEVRTGGDLTTPVMAFGIDYETDNLYTQLEYTYAITPYTEDGIACVMTAHTGEWSGSPETQSHYKHFRGLRLDMECPANTVSQLDYVGNSTGNTYSGTTGATIQVVVDGAVAHTITIANSAAAIAHYYRLPPGIRGKRIQLRLTGVFKLHGASVDYELVRRP